MGRARSLARPRVLLVGIAWGMAAGMAMAIPTAVAPNRFFTRMTPVRAQDYVFLGVASLLIAAVGATYAVPDASSTCQARTAGGGVLNALAIGCPICNKVVVFLLGVSGALTYWAPLQPVVGVMAIGILGWTLYLRLSALGAAPRLNQRPANDR